MDAAEPTFEWEAELRALDARLERWHADVERELARIRAERGLDRWWRRPSRRTLQELLELARARVGESLMLELTAFADRLCDHYLASGPQERAKVRARAGSHDAFFRWLWGYVEQSAEHVRTPDDGPRLRRALAALSIDDLRADLDLIDRALGRLYLAALRAGLDPDAEIARVARVSNPASAGGGAHMRSYLTGYVGSKAYLTDVSAEAAALRKRALVESARADAR
jgi:hypothetical protein